MTHVGDECAPRQCGAFRYLLGLGQLRGPGAHMFFQLILLLQDVLFTPLKGGNIALHDDKSLHRSGLIVNRSNVH